MSDYIVYTDSACDISPEILDQWGVKYLSLTFRFEGDDTEYSNKCIEYIDSYNQAVSDTVNSPDYPQNVVYPEYKLPEREN